MDLILLGLIIFIPLIAQAKVNGAYKKYSKELNSMNLTGADVARKILDKNGLIDVKITETNGQLTDHYDPRTKTVTLSKEIHSEKSIASVAVAAHEVGHAIQHKESYSFLNIRTKLVPAVNLTSKISTIFIFIGFFSEIFEIAYIGIALLLVGLLFQLVTLPVEFNASKRAKKELQNCGLISNKDTKGTNKVLNAAAFTYVAGFIATAAEILRLFLISKSRD